MFIRKTTSYPEGVSYAVLIANLFVPFINKHTKPRVFGKEYNMKEIKTALISLVAIIMGVFAIIKLDASIDAERQIKNEEYKKNEIMKIIPQGEKIGADEDTFIQEGYLFRPVMGKNNEIIAYVVEAQAKGYSHYLVDFILAIDTEGTTIGYKVTHQTETKGLGSKIAEDQWQNVFIGLDKNSEFEKDKDSFAGATYTFTNMYKEIKKILEAFDGYLKDNISEEDMDGEAGATESGDDEWSINQKRDDFIWV